MSEFCDHLMIGSSHKKDPISLLETLKDTTESQGVTSVKYVNHAHLNTLQIQLRNIRLHLFQALWCFKNMCNCSAEMRQTNSSSKTLGKSTNCGEFAVDESWVEMTNGGSETVLQKTRKFEARGSSQKARAPKRSEAGLILLVPHFRFGRGLKIVAYKK